MNPRTNGRYAAHLEVGSSFGCFGAPDTGSEVTSYPMITASGAEGITSSIFWIRGVKTVVVAVATCTFPQYVNYSFNSHSPLRKTGTIKQDQACQVRATVLEKPRFQILVTFENKEDPSLLPQHRNINRAHYCQDMFMRRLKAGRFYHPPCMGWKEFGMTYCGPILTPKQRVEQKVGSICTEFNTVLPSMLYRVFNDAGDVQPEQLHNVRVENGVVRYTKDPVTVSSEGILMFGDNAFQRQINDSIARPRFKARRAF